MPELTLAEVGEDELCLSARLAPPGYLGRAGGLARQAFTVSTDTRV